MIATRKASDERHPVGRRAGPGARRRVRRPRAVEPHADQRRRLVEARRVRRAQLPLRHPRARDGRDRQRPRRSSGLRGVRRHVPDLQRLHEAGDPPGRADGTCRRSTSSRTTRSASARTARRTSRSSSSRRCARRPNIDVDPPGRRQRDRARAGATRCAQTDRPTVLALSRQDLPMSDPSDVPADAVERGAWVLSDSRRRRPDADPDRHRLARSASPSTRAKLLEADGVSARRGQHAVPGALRRAGRRSTATACCPPAVRARVPIEAGEPVGWHRYVGDAATLDRRWRVSAPPAPQPKVLYEHFGFTAEKVASTARVAKRPRPQRLEEDQQHERHTLSTRDSPA